MRNLKLLIMSWITRPETKRTNPATKFLEWSSDNGCFKFYDKETKENVMVALPLEFVILEHYHTVKGWSDSEQSGIYANEVFGIGVDEMIVKTFSGKTIAKGLYKDFKPTVVSSGGHYARSIYAITKDLELINISLKGSGVSSYSDFVKAIGDHNFDKHWVKVTGAQELKKGKVNYTIPVFEKGVAIKDPSKIQPFADTLMDYMTSYVAKDKPSANIPPQPPIEAYEDNDVPF